MKKSNTRSKISILAIDIGNTSVAVSLISHGSIQKTKRFLTCTVGLKTALEIKKYFPCRDIQAAVIASVVPKAGEALRLSIARAIGKKTLIIGKDILAPITNKYSHPEKVGMDRLMNAIAAFEIYKKPSVIIDFGTAITFDVVSKKGEYLGGVIAPGIEISLEALYRKTALLPRIKLAAPKNIIGKDTVESIRAGCSYGIGGLCDRIVDEIKKEMRFNPIVVATGGYSRFMSRYCHSIDLIDDDLIMKGIFMTYQSFLSKSIDKKNLK